MNETEKALPTPEEQAKADKAKRFEDKANALLAACGKQAHLRKGGYRITGPLLTLADGTPLLIRMGAGVERVNLAWLKPRQRKSLLRLLGTGRWKWGFGQYQDYPLKPTVRTEKEFKELASAAALHPWGEEGMQSMVVNTCRMEMQGVDLGKLVQDFLSAMIGRSRPPGLTNRLRALLKRNMKEVPRVEG